ncbi:hypothetical protein Btru_032058 [Bulinus truncatus]|nr:hypothetical protein Btru_032058 [Bulinus truncatus]
MSRPWGIKCQNIVDVTSLHPDVTTSLATRNQSIIVDSSETEIISVFKGLLQAHNTREGGTNKVVLNASWYNADIDNNCDLIKAICRRLESGVFLLLGSSSSRSYNIIQSYSHALHVPYVVYSPTTNHEADGYDYDVTVSPSYVRALVDIIRFFNWEKVYYVFDSDNALWELQRLHDAFSFPRGGVIFDARRVRNVTSSHDFLRQLDRFSTSSGMKRIVLNLSSKEAYQRILNQNERQEDRPCSKGVLTLENRFSLAVV